MEQVGFEALGGASVHFGTGKSFSNHKTLGDMEDQKTVKLCNTQASKGVQHLIIIRIFLTEFWGFLADTLTKYDHLVVFSYFYIYVCCLDKLLDKLLAYYDL